jgi:hypothetical protein
MSVCNGIIIPDTRDRNLHWSGGRESSTGPLGFFGWLVGTACIYVCHTCRHIFWTGIRRLYINASSLSYKPQCLLLFIGQ